MTFVHFCTGLCISVQISCACNNLKISLLNEVFLKAHKSTLFFLILMVVYVISIKNI